MDRLEQTWNAVWLAVLMSIAALPAYATVPSVVMSNHQTLYSSLTNGTYGIAANARGDIFFSDYANNSLDMLAAGSTTATVLLTGMNAPHQVTVDSSGNVYVTDTSNGKVYRVPFYNGTYAANVAVSTFNASSGSSSVFCASATAGQDCRLSGFGTIVGNYASISGVALDSAGNFYLFDISDSNGASSTTYSRILKQTPSGTTTIYVNNLTAVSSRAELASDAAGNLYYADTSKLYSIPVSTGVATAMNTSTLSSPSGVALDQAGNLLVSDYGNSRIAVIPNESGSLNFSDQYVLAPYSTRSSVGIDGKGTIYYPGNSSGASTVSAMQASIYNVASLAVNSSSTSALVYSVFNASTTVNNYQTAGNGATMGYSANSCTFPNTYTAGQSCAFNTNIKPLRVGPVSGIIGLVDSSGNYLAQFTEMTNGTGSAVTVDPGTANLLTSTYTTPNGVVVDKAGNVFIADTGANTVYELVGGSGTPVSLGTGLVHPTGVAVDATGNLFIADTGNARVVEIPIVGTTLKTAQQSVVASGLTAPLAIASGPSDSLYIAQAGSLALYANRGYTAPVETAVISTAFAAPRALTVDPSGNIFIGDSALGEVVELAAYTYAQTVIASSLPMPTGLATDAAGDLFVADNTKAVLMRIPNISGALTYAQAVTMGSLTAPYGVGIDAQGNLYVSNSTTGKLYQVARTAATVNFGTIATNSTSPAETAYIVSSGTSALTLGSPYYTASGDTTHFSVTSGGSCAAGGTINAGSTCTIDATFAPTVSGATSEVLAISASPTVTTSPLNVTLTGAGAALTLTTTTITPSKTSASYGTSLTVAVGVAPNSGTGTPTGTVTLTATPAGGNPTTLLNAVTLTNGAASYTGQLPTGVDSVVATYSGDANYSASSATTTVTITQIVPQITWSPSATSQVYGTAIGSGVLDAAVASPAGNIAYTSNTSTGICGTAITASCFLNTGTYTLTATFTPTDTADYTTATATITYTVTAAPPLSPYVPKIVMSDHQTLYSGLTNGTYGVAANARGDVFFADIGANTVDMLPAGSTTPVVLLTGFNNGTRSVIVDSSNNVYATDYTNGKVYRVPYNNGSYPTGVAISSFNGSSGTFCSTGLTVDCRLAGFGNVTGNHAQITSIAIDSAGNVYGADVSDGISSGAYSRIFKQTPSGTVTIVVDALPATTNAQIVVDAQGNLYYTDATSLYMVAAGTATATVMNASSLKNPSGVLLDPAGNLIVSDYGNSRIVVIPNEGGSLNFSDQYMLAPYAPRCSVGMDAKGTIYYPGNTSGSTSVSAMQTSVYGVPSLAVGASSTSALVYVAFNQATTISQYLTTGNGATMGYAGYTCTFGSTYAAGQSCGFNTSIKPSRVGAVSGTIGLADASGNYYSQFTLTANATGSAVAIDPGTPASIGSGFTSPAGVAVDKAGNVFIADTKANAVYELVGGSGTPVAVGSGWKSPTAVAVDATGNLFVADIDSNGKAEVSTIPFFGTALVTSKQAVVVSGLTAPLALATGPLNSLYIAQSGSLLQYINRGYSTPANSATIVTTPTASFLTPTSLTVDGAGNIYLGDANTGEVVEIAAYTNALTVVGSGYTTPSGLVTDAAGDLFVADSGTGQATRIPNISGVLTPAQAVSLGSFNTPTGLGVDELGNLYVSDPSVPAVYKITRTTGLVNLGYASLGATTPAGSGSLLSSGTQSLTLGSPVYAASGDTTHFTVTAASTCTAGQTLAAGTSCTLTDTFTPTATGSSSELLTLSASPTVTTSPLNLTFTAYGTVQVATTLTVSQGTGGTLSYGQSATFKATLSPSQFNVAAATGTVTFTINGIVQKPIAISSNTASITTNALTGGSNTISAVYSGDINYAASSSTAFTVAVTPGTTATTLTITTPFVNPASSAPGSTVTLTAQVVPSVPGVLSGTVNFVSGSTVLGSASLSAISSTLYQAQFISASIPAGTYNVTAVYVGSLNYSGSSSASSSLLISAPTILLTPASTGFTSTPSTPGSVAIAVASVAGLGTGSSAPVVFSCSGLPANTYCQVVPAALSLAASPSSAPVAAQQVVVTVYVNYNPGNPTPPLAQLSPRERGGIMLACLLAMPLLVFVRRNSKRRSLLLMLVLVCILPVVSLLAGCGSSVSFVTPTGTTPITITATSSSATTSITLNLTVAK